MAKVESSRLTESQARYERASLQAQLTEKFNKASQEQREKLPFGVIDTKTPGWEDAVSGFQNNRLIKGITSIVFLKGPLIAKVAQEDREMLIGVTDKGDALVFLSWNPYSQTNGEDSKEGSGDLKVPTIREDGSKGEFTLDFHNLIHASNAFAMIYGVKDTLVSELLEKSLI